jgi:hypothetical protein
LASQLLGIRAGRRVVFGAEEWMAHRQASGAGLCLFHAVVMGPSMQ